MAREKTETMTTAAREPFPSAPNPGTEVGASEARARPGRRSVEDRQQAVLELFAGKATVDQLARRFGVKPETIEAWREEALAAMREGFRRGSKSPRERELERELSQVRDALTESAIAQALLERELEAARSANPSQPARSRR
jgi:transposase-like protein